MDEKLKKLLRNPKTIPVLFAILSAVLCSISTPFSKSVMGMIGPSFLAGFLYTGAGLGMGIIYLFNFKKEKKEERLEKKDLPYLIALLFCDIFAAVFTMFGIANCAAANAALLSNMEIVVTAVVALIFFKEKISPKLWFGIFLILAASVLLSVKPGQEGQLLSFSVGSIYIIIATICWGLENNFSKMISGKSNYQISTIKGLTTGVGSFVIGLCLHEKISNPIVIPIAMVVGFLAYGVSIFVYLRAQKGIGAAKTSAFFAISPFIAAFLSFILFKGEDLSFYFAIGLGLMILGNIFAAMDTLHVKKYKAIVFDMDGTLLDTMSGIISAINKTFETLGFQVKFTNEDGKHFIGAGSAEFARRALARANIEGIDLMKFREIFLSNYEKFQATQTKPFDGLDKLLIDLKEHKYKIGICSNKPQELLDKVVQQMFPDVKFDFIVGQRPGVPCKPSPRMFWPVKKAVRTLNKNILYVGDSEYDYQFARNSLIDSCIVTYGYGIYSDRFMRYVTHTVNSVQELREMLL